MSKKNNNNNDRTLIDFDAPAGMGGLEVSTSGRNINTIFRWLVLLVVICMVGFLLYELLKYSNNGNKDAKITECEYAVTLENRLNYELSMEMEAAKNELLECKSNLQQTNSNLQEFAEMLNARGLG